MKKIILICVVFLMCISSIVPAWAAPESKYLYVDKQKSVVMCVTWDVEQPTVVFIAPDGTTYDPLVTTETTRYFVEGNTLYFVVEDAMQGDWRIDYEKGANTLVDITMYNYNTPIIIDYFNIGAVNGDELPVSFFVKGEENLGYNFRISAMIDRTGAEKELKSGWAYTGSEQTATLNLDDLSTYDKYCLKLYIWYAEDGTDVFDTMFSEEFSYTNSDMDGKAPEYTLTVEPEQKNVYIAWENLDWSVDEVLVALFENDGAEPIVFDTYTKNDSSIQLAYSPSATEISVEVSVKYDGINTAPTRKTVSVVDIPISLTDGVLFNTLQLPLNYKGLKDQAAKVEINEKYTDLVLNGDGNINLMLADDWNKIKVTYTDVNSINWLIERDVFVDRIAPLLNIGRNYDGMVLDAETIAIYGTVQNGNSVTVNGQECTIDANGSFSSDVKLNVGANKISVVAKDAAGNESVYTATVTRSGGKDDSQVETKPDSTSDVETKPIKKEDYGKWHDKLFGEGSYFVLICVSVLCLLVIIYAIVFWRKSKKLNKVNNSKEEEYENY